MTFPSDVPIRLSKLSELAGEPISTLQQAISEGELKARKKGRAWYVTLDWFRSYIESEVRCPEGTVESKGRRDGTEGREEMAGDTHHRREEAVWPADKRQVKGPGTRKAQTRKGKSGKALIFDISQKLDREKNPGPYDPEPVQDDSGNEGIG